MSSPAILTYWDGRGLSEIVRLMLEICGEPWIEQVYGFEGDQNISTLEQFKSITAAGVLCFDQVILALL